jgi:hypothetical protein
MRWRAFGWATALLACVIAGEVAPTHGRVTFGEWFCILALVLLAPAVIIARTRAWPATTWARWVLLALIGTAMLHLAFGPVYFRAAPLTATVVDDQTWRPVSGATVRVEWRLRAYQSLESDRDAGLLHAATAVTRPDGSFSIPSWGVVLRPPFTWIGSDAPRLTITAGRTRHAVNNATREIFRDGQIIVVRIRHNRWAANVGSDWAHASIPIPIE